MREVGLGRRRTVFGFQTYPRRIFNMEPPKLHESRENFPSSKIFCQSHVPSVVFSRFLEIFLEVNTLVHSYLARATRVTMEVSGILSIGKMHILGCSNLNKKNGYMFQSSTNIWFLVASKTVK